MLSQKACQLSAGGGLWLSCRQFNLTCLPSFPSVGMTTDDDTRPIATLPTFPHIRQHTRERCSIAPAPDWLLFRHHDLIIAFSQPKQCENPFIHSQAMAVIVTTVYKDLGIGPVSLRHPPSICYRGHLSDNRETRYEALHRSVRISYVHPTLHCILDRGSIIRLHHLFALRSDSTSANMADKTADLTDGTSAGPVFAG